MEKHDHISIDLLYGKAPLNPSVVYMKLTFWEYWLFRIKKFFGK